MRRFTQRKGKSKGIGYLRHPYNIQKNCYTSITDGEKLKNSLKKRMVQIYNCFAFIHSCLFWCEATICS